MHRQTAFAKVCAEEARLRNELTRLDTMATDAERQANNQQRAIGADVIWKAWVGRTKASLNRELALVLAQKDSMLSSVRREYGKLIVAEELARKSEDVAQKEFQSRRLLNAIEQHQIKGRR